MCVFLCPRSSHRRAAAMAVSMVGENLWTCSRSTRGERMAEEGTLSIVRHGSPYRVRYASNNPRDRERQPYECPDVDTLDTLLHQLGAESGAIMQAYAELGKGRMAVLFIVLSAEQIQAFFA